MLKIIKKIHSLPWLIQKKYENRNNSARLERITNEVKTLLNMRQSKTRILFGPSFSPYHLLKLHDVLFTSLLSSKGAKIAYTSTPFGLPACDKCGGISQAIKTQARLCVTCQRFQRNDDHLTHYLSRYAKIYRLQDFLTQDDIHTAERLVTTIKTGELETFTYQGIPLGEFAANQIRNLKYVGSIALIEDHQSLLRKYTITNLLFHKYFVQTIADYKPEIIITHDAFFSPWGILHELGRKMNIPVYNYYPGIRHNTFFYVKNRITFDLDISRLFNKWKNREIKHSELNRIQEIFNERRRGNIQDADIRKEKSNVELESYNELLQSSKPLAVMYASVIWDLAALNKEATFRSIQESYLATIKYFKAHPEYNLIIKPHPADELRSHPSRESTLNLIRQVGKLPPNILLLDPKTIVGSYELVERSNVSIVYVSTLGIESVILGTPTILLGKAHYRDKGFTFDPANESEFNSMLTSLLSSDKQSPNEKTKMLAKKYYYLLNYVNWHDFKIMKFNFKARSKATVTPRTLGDLLANHDFSKLAEAIINKQEIPFFDSNLT